MSKKEKIVNEMKKLELEIIRDYILCKGNTFGNIPLPHETKELTNLREYHAKNEEMYGSEKAAIMLEEKLASLSVTRAFEDSDRAETETDMMYFLSNMLLNGFYEATNVSYEELVENVLNNLNEDNKLLRVRSDYGLLDIEYKITIYGEPKYSVYVTQPATGERKEFTVNPTGKQEISLFSKETILNAILLSEKKVDDRMRKNFVEDFLKTAPKEYYLSKFYPSIDVINDSNLSDHDKITAALNIGATAVLKSHATELSHTDLIALYKDTKSGKYCYKAMGTNQSNLSLSELSEEVIRDDAEETYYMGGLIEYNIGTRDNPSLRLNVKTREISPEEMEKEIQLHRNWRLEFIRYPFDSVKEKEGLRKLIRTYYGTTYNLNHSRVYKDLDTKAGTARQQQNEYRFHCYQLLDPHSNVRMRHFIFFLERGDAFDVFDVRTGWTRLGALWDADAEINEHAMGYDREEQLEIRRSCDAYTQQALYLMFNEEIQLAETDPFFANTTPIDTRGEEDSKSNSGLLAAGVDRFFDIHSYLRYCRRDVDSIFDDSGAVTFTSLDDDTDMKSVRVDADKLYEVVEQSFPKLLEKLNDMLRHVRKKEGDDTIGFADIVERELVFYKIMRDIFCDKTLSASDVLTKIAYLELDFEKTYEMV